VIENVVFDIGWVLVRFDYGPLIELLAAHGAAQRTRDAVMEGIGLDEHETGRLSGAQLLLRLQQLAKLPLPLAAIEERWLGMFELEERMFELAQRVSAQQRVYLLSNIGELHWGQLSRAYRMHDLGHGALLSYEAGVMKPHAGIYSAAEERFALAPGRTVFIDDRADNIASARRRGWAGIVHESHARTHAALHELGVAC
jgi:HAD superfamily hydrolase (TIGR01509 family)